MDGACVCVRVCVCVCVCECVCGVCMCVCVCVWCVYVASPRPAFRHVSAMLCRCAIADPCCPFQYKVPLSRMNSVVSSRIGKATYDPSASFASMDSAIRDAEAHLNDDYWWAVDQQRRRRAFVKEREESFRQKAREEAAAALAAAAPAPEKKRLW